MNKLIGQTFMIGVSGKQLLPEEAKFINKENIGGVVLFAHNYESPAQLAELVNDIQKCRNDYPLFIAVDQEGGRVQRFKNGFSIIPPMAELGKIDSPKTTYEVHALLAKELKAVGVNLNFSPVCDVWSNPQNKVIGDRAFSNSTEIVEKHVSAAIRGLHLENIIACAKHFPGHGSTKKDSHLDLPFVTLTKEQWEQLELPPFQKATKARADMVMMAHLIVDMFDKNFPCTLSKNAYDALRTLLKFSKVTITDDLEMNAIKDHFGLEQSTIKALQVGADIVLFRSFDVAVQCYEVAIKAYESKDLTAPMMGEKHQRIEALKKEKLHHYKPVIIPELHQKMNVSAHQEYLKKLSEKVGLTLPS